MRTVGFISALFLSAAVTAGPVYTDGYYRAEHCSIRISGHTLELYPAGSESVIRFNLDNDQFHGEADNPFLYNKEVLSYEDASGFINVQFNKLENGGTMPDILKFIGRNPKIKLECSNFTKVK